MERKLPVESIYGLEFYPKHFLNKIIRNSFLAPNYFVHPLNILFVIKNCQFLFVQIRPKFWRKDHFPPKNAIILTFLNLLFFNKLGLIWTTKKSFAGDMPEHVVYQFLAIFDLKCMFKGCTSKNLWKSWFLMIFLKLRFLGKKINMRIGFLNTFPI